MEGGWGELEVVFSGSNAEPQGTVLFYWPLGWSPLPPRSPLYGRGFWICGRDTRVFSRVYGVSPRGCCGFVVTAVTVIYKLHACERPRWAGRIQEGWGAKKSDEGREPWSKAARVRGEAWQEDGRSMYQRC
jgi:hypothetical protein